MKQTRKARTPSADTIDQAAPAWIVVSKFGGLARICEIAQQNGIKLPTSTVWGWVRRGDIPPRRVPEIKALALKAKPIVRLKDSDFIRQTAA